MPLSVAQLKKYRSRFAWVSAISLVVLISSLFFITQTVRVSTLIGHLTRRPLSSPLPARRPLSSPLPSRGFRPVVTSAPYGGAINLATLISVASLLTSTTSLVGFFFTTGIAWRKERREKQAADLDLERKRLEVEQLRLEVERKKQESSPATGSPNDVA